MLVVHLDPYRTRRPDGRPLDFTVELDDEGGISVTIDVDPRELVGTVRRNTDADAALDLLLDVYPEHLEVSSGTPGAEALMLANEVRRLRDVLGAVVDSIELHPEPGEARAIAAALVHHADEVDRLFGRRI